MKFLKFNMLLLAVATTISLAPLKIEAINKNNDSFSNDDLTIIIQHHIKAVKKNSARNDTLWVKKTVYVYSHTEGKIDSLLVDLSKLEINMENVVFIDLLDSSKNSLKINRIKYFVRKNIYEVLSDVASGISGGYSASYIYKRRKGLFKRWVYKRFVGRIWCGSF
jgi:hypothetical protein